MPRLQDQLSILLNSEERVSSHLGKSHYQWQIQDFPEGGAPTLRGGANLLFA